MKFFFYALLVVWTGGVCCAQSLPGDEAKPPLAVGVYGNYHLTNHTLNGAQLQGIDNCCPDFDNLGGNSLAFGALVEFPLSNVLKLNLRGGYQNLKTVFTVNQTYGKAEDPDIDANVPVTTEKRLDADIPMLTLEPEVSYRLLGRLNVHAGVRTAFVLSPEYHYEEEIVTSGLGFKNGSKVRHATDGSFDDVSSLLLAGVVGVSYDLSFGKNILAPEFRYAIPLNGLTDADWKATTLHIGAAFKIPIRPAPEVTILRDTVYRRDTSIVAVKGIAESRVRLDDVQTSRDTVLGTGTELHRTTIAERYVFERPVKSELRTDIAAVATLASDGSVVPAAARSVEQVEFQDNFPILPYVFFPEGSSDLRQSNLRLLTVEQTAGFSVTGLANDDPLGLYPDLLNIIGERLRRMPKATITLTGCNNDIGVENNNLALSSARAQAVKDYLTTVWGIDGRRIAVKSRNLPSVPSNNTYADGQEENRRVEITGDRSILAPAAIRTYAYESSFGSLRIEPAVAADAGVRSWSLAVTRNGETLKEFRGEGEPSAIVWPVDAKTLAAQREPLTVQLTVTDIDGQSATDEQTVPIQFVTVQEKRADKKEDKRIERYFLVLFDYNSADLTADHRKSIVELADKLRSRANAEVTIHGYTDRTGTGTYNEQLAQRRAELVKSTLNYPKEHVRLLPMGSKVLLFDNDHPVGRFYSRTVEIVVETPVPN